MTDEKSTTFCCARRNGIVRLGGLAPQALIVHRTPFKLDARELGAAVKPMIQPPLKACVCRVADVDDEPLRGFQCTGKQGQQGRERERRTRRRGVHLKKKKGSPKVREACLHRNSEILYINASHFSSWLRNFN